MTLPHNVLPFVHQLLSAHLQAGDVALDATAGNGHDTLHLARCVGRHGQVWAFDIQARALDSACARLTQAGLETCVRWVCADHQHLDRHLTVAINAAVFNLGYLPHADKTLSTQHDSTLSALGKALTLLRDNGLLTLVLYGGHAAGAAECVAVEAWAANLPQQQYDILRYQFANRPTDAPYALIFRKLPTSA